MIADDIINAKADNDIIFGGLSNDDIDTGARNDILVGDVYWEKKKNSKV
jgi:Ca2+-binding RTX toxin-like protein